LKKHTQAENENDSILRCKSWHTHEKVVRVEQAQGEHGQDHFDREAAAINIVTCRISQVSGTGSKGDEHEGVGTHTYTHTHTHTHIYIYTHTHTHTHTHTQTR